MSPVWSAVTRASLEVCFGAAVLTIPASSPARKCPSSRSFLIDLRVTAPYGATEEQMQRQLARWSPEAVIDRSKHLVVLDGAYISDGAEIQLLLVPGK
jgi:hypothetical protein